MAIMLLPGVAWAQSHVYSDGNGGYVIPPTIGSGSTGSIYIRPNSGGGYSVQEPLGRPYVGDTQINPDGNGGFTIDRPLGADDD